MEQTEDFYEARLGGPQGGPPKEGPRGAPDEPRWGALRATQTLEEELRGAETYEDYLDSFITDQERMYLKEVR
ncbi:hypothetical protein Emag_000483 [Eimeria magna]